MNSQPDWRPDQQKTSSPAEILRSLRGLAAVAIVVLFGAIVAANLGDDQDNSSTDRQQTRYQQSVDTRNKLHTDATLSDPSTYEEISKRDFEVILKDLRAQDGRRIVLYGSIWHFDGAVGLDRFLAHVGTSTSSIGNTESAHLVGDPAMLKPFVKGDDVKMFVVVDGEYSYTSKADVEITVPQFQIGIIEFAE
ncbi:hypothetical protein [Rhodococcus sp. IEGM 1406]|uniref:hypothetical protein n=1 Tax=Rhodococcus sp. IEGM 1406 TaxID=3047083 RepID=UPI0024B7675E|nr:hypothetical protein [Rhodococcus sp. IEGM 1406]MDI9905621.1 hypothetical protein [Rhodococcus sp. IEGM 1406]